MKVIPDHVASKEAGPSSTPSCMQHDSKQAKCTCFGVCGVELVEWLQWRECQAYKQQKDIEMLQKMQEEE